jgi:hypothetical protein
MPLMQLAYVSTPSPDMKLADVKAIVAKAQAFNTEHELTGSLLFRPKTFIQILEGRRSVVTELFAKIANDPRHRDIELLGAHRIHEREFHDWSMAFIPLDKVGRELVLRYAGSSDLRHDELSFHSTVKLARSVVEYHQHHVLAVSEAA